MNEILNALRDLAHETSEQRQWWTDNKETLSSEQVHQILDFASENKFAYLGILIQIIVDTADTSEEFVSNFKIISDILGQGLMWGKLYQAIDEELETNESLASDIYDLLPAEDELWARSFVGTIMRNMPHSERDEEIVRLLSSRNENQISVAVQGLRHAYPMRALQWR